MPDVVRLRYVDGRKRGPVHLAVLGREVEPDCIVDFAGRVISSEEDWERVGLDEAAHADAVVVELGNPPEVRVFPRSDWADETPAKTSAKSDDGGQQP